MLNDELGWWLVSMETGGERNALLGGALNTDDDLFSLIGSMSESLLSSK